MTITEALAELKTLAKRITKKREFVRQHIARQHALRDPMEEDGGSRKVISSELQAIGDLERRMVAIRLAILETNLQTSLNVNGETKSVQAWLTWRREVSKGRQSFLRQLNGDIENVRREAQKRGWKASEDDANPAPNDLIVNLSERKLHEDTEALESRLGDLDGRLSLVNATTHIELANM